MFIYMSETTNPKRRMKYVNMLKTRVVALAFLIIGTSINYLERVKENFTFEVDDFDIDWENDDDCLGI
jgi:hypothetical protein